MKSKLISMYYSEHKIAMTEECAKQINWLCGQGISFFVIIDRIEDRLYKIVVGSPEDADAECQRLQREFGDKYSFIMDYIHNGR